MIRKLIIGTPIGIPEFVSRFRSLNTLVLDNLVVDGSSGYGRSDLSFQWITGVLQQLSSPILVFEVTTSDHLELKRIPWTSIDKIVCPTTQQFRELVRVEVLVKRGVYQKKNYPCSVARDLALAEVEQKLPALNRLGLLRCDTEGY
jgi:hypothetical protein